MEIKVADNLLTVYITPEEMEQYYKKENSKGFTLYTRIEDNLHESDLNTLTLLLETALSCKDIIKATYDYSLVLHALGLKFDLPFVKYFCRLVNIKQPSSILDKEIAQRIITLTEDGIKLLEILNYNDTQKILGVFCKEIDVDIISVLPLYEFFRITKIPVVYFLRDIHSVAKYQLNQ